jgi:putative PEP-CTERM system histidine kinase
MQNVGVISYATGASVFLLLALVLMTGKRGRRHKNLLMLAALASAIWMFVTAYAAAHPSVLMVSYLLEPLRDLALMGFLVQVLSSAYSGAQQTAARMHRNTMRVLSSFTLLVLMMLVYRGVSGRQLLAAGAVDLLLAGFLIMAIAGLVLVEQLIRNTRGDSRRSVKYLCFGLGAIFAYDFYLYSNALMFQGVDAALWNARGFANALVVPIIGFAAARDPQWSLDIFVSRRVVFHTAALLAAGLYLLAMGLGGYIIREHGGTWGTIAQVTFLFGAVLMLLILLFSAQLRASLRVLINKHFFHYKFEYRDEWLRFIRTLTSDEPDEQLRERTVIALAQIHGCPGGMLWMGREGNRFELVAHSQMPPVEASCCVELSDSVVSYLRDRQWIYNYDEHRHGRHAQSDLILPKALSQLATGWLIVPLIFHDRLLGMVVLGRPPIGHSLNWEDYDLLRILGRQSAVHLAQLEAAQALSQAREFEACNRISAYVMHDLKNLIGQLSLVVSNASRHKHNPQFMEDAIQTVDNSVAKMNRLLATLRSGRDPRQKLSLLNVCDVLGEVVRTMAAGTPRPRLDLQATGLVVRADRDRLGAVIGHVVRNAQDATPEQGMVIVRLFKLHDQAVIEVQDNGAGMDEAFLRERLFKPFETTKGGAGMGIGAYETRDYVRGLGGEVEVMSRPDEGTTFRLRIPISEELRNDVNSTDNTNNGKPDDIQYKEIAGY